MVSLSEISTDYLETIDGQRNEWFKRTLKTNYLTINQEPRSKNSISPEEKVAFRKQVLEQLKERERKAHTGDLIVEIDFFTTQHNPPSLHALAKNYLDLLHKPLPDLDNHKSLLFKDDRQVKILIANYHLNIFGHEPQIRISSYPLSNFIKDVELANRILQNDFKEDRSHSYKRLFDHFTFMHERERDEHAYETRDVSRDLRKMRENKNSFISRLGELTYTLQEHYFVRTLQERFLKANQFSIHDAISIFQSQFDRYKKYKDRAALTKVWDITRDYIFFATDFVDLGGVPRMEERTKVFKSKLKKQLEEFRDQHTILFPLINHINITITYVPPIHEAPDVDNLAIKIIPLLTEVFQPPPTHHQTFSVLKHLSVEIEEEKQLLQRLPPHSIAAYQVVHIPRKEGDPEEGRVGVFISDGFINGTNIWRLIDELIDQWEKKIRRY